MSDEQIIVTNENFGDLLIQSANEALSYVRGTGTARVRIYHGATAPPHPPPAYDAAHIRRLRVRLGFNQRVFARPERERSDHKGMGAGRERAFGSSASPARCGRAAS